VHGCRYPGPGAHAAKVVHERVRGAIHGVLGQDLPASAANQLPGDVVGDR